MERDKSRKRRRDQEDEKTEPHKGKKQKFISSIDDDSCSRDNAGYELCDAIGVFDFPWLKEGVMIFKVDEYLEREDMFALCSCIDQVQDIFGANILDQSCVQNSVLVPPALDQHFYNNKFDGENLWSFQVDDFEPSDWIWSSILDQPDLDNIGLNKA